MTSQWQPGRSGNPKGRPKGTRDKRLALLLSNEKKLQRKLVKMALAGDHRALQICADRLWPKLRPEALPVRIQADGSDLATQGQAIIASALSGQLTPDVLRHLLSALADQARLVEFTEIEGRLQALETKPAAPPWQTVQQERELLPIRGKHGSSRR